jgi:plasmid stabilization system protein ParE
MGTKMYVDTSLRYEVELNKILDFIGENNPMNALNFAKKLEVRINALPHFPYKYRRSQKVNDENIRDLVFMGYVIPYRVNSVKERIEILGIFSENKWKIL